MADDPTAPAAERRCPPRSAGALSGVPDQVRIQHRHGPRHPARWPGFSATGRRGPAPALSAARDPRAHRPRRHGRGLQGAAAVARPPRGAEDPAARARRRSRLRRAVRPRGAGPRPAARIRTSSPSTTSARRAACYYLAHGVRRRREPAAGAARRGRLHAGAGAGASCRRSARRCNSRTTTASCIATSSRRTSCSTETGRVKIADFGLAKLARSRTAADTMRADRQRSDVMGTPHYMAPEQIEQPARRRSPRGHLLARRRVLRAAHGRAAAGPVRAAVAACADRRAAGRRRAARAGEGAGAALSAGAQVKTQVDDRRLVDSWPRPEP